MVGFRARMTEANRKVATRAVNQFPQMSVTLHTKTSKGQVAAGHIEGVVNGSATQIVRQYLCAHEIHNLLVIERGPKEGKEMEAVLVNDVWRSLFPKVFSVEASIGDGAIPFKPSFYWSLSREDKPAVVEHEMWHIFLDKVFPEWESMYQSLFRGWDPDFSLLNYFDLFLGHFFLNVVAIGSGRKDSVDTCTQFQLRGTLEDLKTKLAPAKGVYGLYPISLPFAKASLCVGLLFQNFFPFRFYGLTELMNKNYQAIKKATIQASDETTFNRAVEFAERILQECMLGNDDVRVEDLTKPIHDLWLGFINDFYLEVRRDLRGIPPLMVFADISEYVPPGE